MKSLRAGIMLASALLSSQAASAKGLELPPTGKWVVDMNDDECSILREFGEGENRLFLKLSTVVPDYGFTLALFGKNAQLKEWRSRRAGEVEVSFGPGGPQARGRFMSAETPETNVLFADDGIYQVAESGNSEEREYLIGDPERYTSVNSISFSGDIKQDLTLQTGGMTNVFKVLDQCKWRQVEAWGLDVEANRGRTSGPKAIMEIMAKIAKQVQAEYPYKARINRMEADMRLRLSVDETGTVTGCKALSLTRTVEFSDVPCRPFLAGGKLFEPARGADGKPIASWTIQVVKYKMVQ